MNNYHLYKKITLREFLDLKEGDIIHDFKKSSEFEVIKNNSVFIEYDDGRLGLGRASVTVKALTIERYTKTKIGDILEITYSDWGRTALGFGLFIKKKVPKQ
jgi:hypothetical protein